ncbi:hypothetical protein AO391_13295 [Pseudomonas marginalis ICMP 9505]|nr:hypothetical protein AO391_13295 [Pseudomonas marginalis ICMP 9505]
MRRMLLIKKRKSSIVRQLPEIQNSNRAKRGAQARAGSDFQPISQITGAVTRRLLTAILAVD